MFVQEAVQEHAEHAVDAAQGAAEKFNAGKTIIEHVSNSQEHPIFHLPKVAGIDFSVTKHVFMLWLVAAFVFIVATWAVRRYPETGPAHPHGIHERPRGGR